MENLRAEQARLADSAELVRLQLVENEEKAARSGAARKMTWKRGAGEAEAALNGHRQELADLGNELRRWQNEKDEAFQVLGDFRVALATKAEEEKKHREVLVETERLLAEQLADLRGGVAGGGGNRRLPR